MNRLPRWGADGGVFAFLQTEGPDGAGSLRIKSLLLRCVHRQALQGGFRREKTSVKKIQLYIKLLFYSNLFYVYNANYRIFHFFRHRGIKGSKMDFKNV